MKSKQKTLTLNEVIKQIRDPRQSSGRRYSLDAILRLVICGLLCGNNNTSEILRWGKRLRQDQLSKLGFKLAVIPSNGTMSNVFAAIDVKHLEKVLGQWVPRGCKKGERLHMAIDGKTLRASRSNGQELAPAVHLLSAYIVPWNKVVAQRKQDFGNNEITTAIELLSELELENRVVTGDAIFAQKKSVK